MSLNVAQKLMPWKIWPQFLRKANSKCEGKLVMWMPDQTCRQSEGERSILPAQTSSSAASFHLDISPLYHFSIPLFVCLSFCLSFCACSPRFSSLSIRLNHSVSYKPSPNRLTHLTEIRLGRILDADETVKPMCEINPFTPHRHVIKHITGSIAVVHGRDRTII